MTLTAWANNKKFTIAVATAVVIGTGALLAGIRIAAGMGERWPVIILALPLFLGVFFQHRWHPTGLSLTALFTGAALIALAVVFFFLRRYGDGYGFTALVVLALGVGHVLTEWRRSLWMAPWRGPVVLAGCAASFYLGLNALSNDPSVGAMLATATGVLAAPVGVSLLTEDALDRWGRKTGSKAGWLNQVGAWPPIVVGVGTVLVAYLMILSGPGTIPVLTSAFVLAFVLMLAISSAAQADIGLVVLVVAAFASVGPSSARLDDQYAADPGEHVIAAMGDSFMSGEGAKVFFAGTNEKDSNECRRAPTAYAAQLPAKGLNVDGVQATDLAFLACSAARAAELYDHAQGTNADTPRNSLDGADQQLLTQLANLRRLHAVGQFDIALMLVSVGGNDAGFSTIGVACIAPGDCSALKQQWLDDLETLVRPKLDAAYFEIARAVDEQFPVAVVPYPIPLNETGCDATWLTAKEHAFLHDFTQSLNNVVEQTAAKYGFAYVADMETALGGGTGGTRLRLCDDPDLRKVGVNFPGLRALGQISGSRLEQRLDPRNWMHNNLHPNEVGHAAMRDVFLRWLAAHPALKPPPAPLASAMRPIVPAPTTRPCDVDELTDVHCQTDARDWALGNTSHLITSHTIDLLLTLCGLWLLSFGVLRARRPVEST